jgi:hypothetical protein
MKTFIDCDTTTLSNNSKLYWQFNCESIWLTLENPNGKRKVIDELPSTFSEIASRLGYHLIKEFEKGILFRSGCAANGPCNYILIDKLYGNILKEFPQLICIDTDISIEDPQNYKFDFVVYLSDTSDHLILYYIDTGKSCMISFKEKLTGVIPEFQFTRMTMADKVLTLFYEMDDTKTKTVSVNLDEKKDCY